MEKCFFLTGIMIMFIPDRSKHLKKEHMFKPLLWMLVGIGMVIIGSRIDPSGGATLLRFAGGFIAGWNFFDVVKYVVTGR